MLANFKLPQIRVQLFGYIFSPGFVPTLATLLLLPLLLGLGIWQLHRAEEKRLLEKEFALSAIPLPLEKLSNIQKNALEYRKVQATGWFDNKHTIFLDNKTYRHQVGYQVVTPFILSHQARVLLVNRGFLPIHTREPLPAIPPALGEKTLIGLAYFPSKPLVLKREKTNNNWPMRVQAINMNQIEQVLQKPLYPFCLLQLNEDGTAFPLIRDWKPVSFPSYRHTGYAIQWFLLALTLVIIYLTLNTSKVR